MLAHPAHGALHPTPAATRAAARPPHTRGAAPAHGCWHSRAASLPTPHPRCPACRPRVLARVLGRYLFPVGFVAIDLASHRPHAFTVARVVHDIVKSCAWLFSMYILWREFRRAVPNNYVLRGWWTMEFIALVVQFASEPESITGGSMGVEVLQIANMMCAVGIAAMALFPKNTHTDSLPLLPGRAPASRSRILRWAMRPTQSGCVPCSSIPPPSSSPSPVLWPL